MKTKTDLVISGSTLMKLKPLSYMKSKETLTFGKWTVDPKGDMSFDEWYHIASDRLNNDNWILHLSQKKWIVWNDFIPAYLQALRNAGIQKLSLLAYYE